MIFLINPKSYKIRHTDYKALVAKQTPESISNFVKEILKAGNHIQVTMMPAEEKK